VIDRRENLSSSVLKLSKIAPFRSCFTPLLPSCLPKFPSYTSLKIDMIQDSETFHKELGKWVKEKEG